METSTYRDVSAGRGGRNKATIRAFCGANGGGKTLAAVHGVLPSLLKGRRVLSTVELLDVRTGKPFENYERLTDWAQILEAKHADIILDEIAGIASSRAQGMPGEVANMLLQLRRNDLTVSWTAPGWARADKLIREVTQTVTICSGYLSKRHKSTGEEEERLWREMRLFRWKTYDAMMFEEWTTAKETRMDALQKSWFWRPGSLAMNSYNTLDSVSRIGETLDGGRCAWCYGTRQPKKCSCEGRGHNHRLVSDAPADTLSGSESDELPPDGVEDAHTHPEPAATAADAAVAVDPDRPWRVLVGPGLD